MVLIQSYKTRILYLQALNGFLIMMTQGGKLLYISDNAAEYLGHSMVSAPLSKPTQILVHNPTYSYVALRNAVPVCNTGPKLLDLFYQILL